MRGETTAHNEALIFVGKNVGKKVSIGKKFDGNQAGEIDFLQIRSQEAIWDLGGAPGPLMTRLSEPKRYSARLR